MVGIYARLEGGLSIGVDGSIRNYFLRRVPSHLGTHVEE
jgi:hypothetical protein